MSDERKKKKHMYVIIAPFTFQCVPAPPLLSSLVGINGERWSNFISLFIARRFCWAEFVIQNHCDKLVLIWMISGTKSDTSCTNAWRAHRCRRRRRVRERERGKLKVGNWQQIVTIFILVMSIERVWSMPIDWRCDVCFLLVRCWLCGVAAFVHIEMRARQRKEQNKRETVQRLLFVRTAADFFLCSWSKTSFSWPSILISFLTFASPSTESTNNSKSTKGTLYSSLRRCFSFFRRALVRERRCSNGWP